MMHRVVAQKYYYLKVNEVKAPCQQEFSRAFNTFDCLVLLEFVKKHETCAWVSFVSSPSLLLSKLRLNELSFLQTNHNPRFFFNLQQDFDVIRL